MSKKIVEMYTDGACSGNPGLFAPEAAKLRGRVGACDFVASRRYDSARGLLSGGFWCV